MASGARKDRGDIHQMLGEARLDDVRLSRWMKSHVEGFRGPLTYARFAGGQSNPTYRIEAASGLYVLRRRPTGPLLPSAHAVDREYRVIAALHSSGFPVPRPFALCLDENVIGSTFYLMELVEGRNLWNGSLPGLEPAERTATYHAMVDTLAALHSVDHEAAGLGDYAKPGDYFERQVGRWTRQYRASQTEPLPDMERLIEWLPRTLPVQERTAIVHGDYRIDNLIFAAAGPRVRAVLDWELSTLGDPLADLTYLLLNWLPGHEASASVAGVDLTRLGIPTMASMIERYCEVTERSEVPDLNWHFSFNLFRLACVVQGIKKRVNDGTASSARAHEIARRVPNLARAAWTCAVRAGA